MFTTNRKQRPLKDIVQELCDFIDKSTLPEECESFIRNPTSLIGRKVKQRFLDEVDGTPTCCYSGTVIDYSHHEKAHCLAYEGESEYCHFDLTLVFILGDLLVLYTYFNQMYRLNTLCIIIKIILWNTATVELTS